MVTRKKTAAAVANVHQQMTTEAANLREEIASVREEVDWVKTSPLPAAESMAVMSVWIDEQAAKFPASQLVSGAVINHRVNIDVLSLSGRMDGRATEGLIKVAGKKIEIRDPEELEILSIHGKG